MNAAELVAKHRKHAGRLRVLGIDTFQMSISARKNNTYHQHCAEISSARQGLEQLGLSDVAELLGKERELLDGARSDDMGYSERAHTKRYRARAIQSTVRKILAGERVHPEKMKKLLAWTT